MRKLNERKKKKWGEVQQTGGCKERKQLREKYTEEEEVEEEETEG